MDLYEMSCFDLAQMFDIGYVGVWLKFSHTAYSPDQSLTAKFNNMYTPGLAHCSEAVRYQSWALFLIGFFILELHSCVDSTNGNGS